MRTGHPGQQNCWMSNVFTQSVPVSNTNTTQKFERWDLFNDYKKWKRWCSSNTFLRAVSWSPLHSMVSGSELLQFWTSQKAKAENESWTGFCPGFSDVPAEARISQLCGGFISIHIHIFSEISLVEAGECFFSCISPLMNTKADLINNQCVASPIRLRNRWLAMDLAVKRNDWGHKLNRIKFDTRLLNNESRKEPYPEHNPITDWEGQELISQLSKFINKWTFWSHFTMLFPNHFVPFSSGRGRSREKEGACRLRSPMETARNNLLRYSQYRGKEQSWEKGSDTVCPEAEELALG